MNQVSLPSGQDQSGNQLDELFMTRFGFWRSHNRPLLKHLQQSRLRIAVVGTPRSGNTWLKNLLGSLYGLTHVICGRPDEVSWEALPERCVLQMHWCPEPELVDLFRRHGIQPVTIIRHPLDTLISILHFCTTWPETSRWFDGRGGNEDSIRGSLPTSPAFLAYSTGPRARALLSISRDWSRVATCHAIYFEDLVNDPAAELARLGDVLEAVSPPALQKSIAENAMEQAQSRVVNQHHWIGTYAHWKRLLPATVARPIGSAHSTTMDLLGYECDPDEALTVAQADLNWFALEILSLRHELSRTRTQMFSLQGRLETAESSLGWARKLFKPLKPLLALADIAVRLAGRFQTGKGRPERQNPEFIQHTRPIARKAA